MSLSGSETVPIPEIVVRKPVLVEYRATLREMKEFTDSRTPASPDELWLLQHPRVFTQGQAGKAEHVLTPGDIPVVQADRGGQVTYHGPGQWVLYLMVDLRRHSLGVRALVDLIENSLVQLLAEYGIEAAARPDAPGVYVAGDKIAALGLRVRKGCSYHGLSLNVDMDLEPFQRINPCGHEGLQVTYHGPGQWVLYLMVDLRRHALGVRALVDLIENSLVQLLAEYGIEAAARPDAPGVYVAGDKIAALGLRVRKGCSYHGLALNVDMDLEPFQRINPCGHEGLQVTSMQNCLPGQALDMETIGCRLVGVVIEQLA